MMNPEFSERRVSALRYIVCTGWLPLVSCLTAFSQHPALASEPAKQHLIVIVGAPGTEEYRTRFQSWAMRWKVAADRADADCTMIGIEADLTPDPEGLITVINDSVSVETTEPLWIVFIGHGTFDGRTASLNLNGPDVSSEEMASLLQPSKRPLAFIACASCSAPFLNALSAPNRVLISATKDGNQVQYSRFGDAISLAIGGLEADINRDGQTSLLEAWLFASRRTAEFYATEGRLATEHALLDDNGDKKGTRAEVYNADQLRTNIENADQIDGSTAARWYLIRSEEERRFTPEQRQMRDDLERQLEELRQRRNSVSETEYLLQLESVLVPLARLYDSIDAQKNPTALPKE